MLQPGVVAAVDPVHQAGEEEAQAQSEEGNMNATERRKDRRRHEKLLAEIAKLKAWNKQLTEKLEVYVSDERKRRLPWHEKLRRAIGTEVLN